MRMTDIIGEPAMFEQLAEEASELAQAALKVARVLRGENPTPVEYKKAVENLTEEYSDLWLCAYDLDLRQDLDVVYAKMNRFWERVSGKNGKGDGTQG